MLVVSLSVAERLVGSLLNRLAASLACESDGSRKLDRSVLGMVSRLAGGGKLFRVGELLCAAIRSEVRMPYLRAELGILRLHA
jgi:hypothetical protein